MPSFFHKVHPVNSLDKLTGIIGLLLFLTLPITANATIVRMQTAFSVIDIQLFDEGAPKTIANFLGYVDNHSYDSSFIHRSVPGSIIQGGGYIADAIKNSLSAVATNAAIANEFSADRSNVRGTIAMAKLPTDPNSAKSQWFINLGDNSQKLDTDNGGYTVFGKIIGKGMAAVDAIAKLPIVDAGGFFTALPTINFTPGNKIKLENLAIIPKVTANHDKSTASDFNRVFAYLEAFYSEFLAPANPLSPADSGSAFALGYNYRYYTSTKAYIGTANDTLYYLGPASNDQVVSLGPVSTWLAEAIAAGY